MLAAGRAKSKRRGRMKMLRPLQAQLQSSLARLVLASAGLRMEPVCCIGQRFHAASISCSLHPRRALNIVGGAAAAADFGCDLRAACV